MKIAAGMFFLVIGIGLMVRGILFLYAWLRYKIEDWRDQQPTRVYRTIGNEDSLSKAGSRRSQQLRPDASVFYHRNNDQTTH